MDASRKDDLKKAAEAWNRASSNPRIERARWWQHPQIVRHINNNVCGQPLPGASAGLNQLLKDRLQEPLSLGISVGCGTGGKEMVLLSQGLVETFHLYEISEVRYNLGKELAIKNGLENRTKFFLRDAFEPEPLPVYDLVYWNNSLHHMLDVDDALRWSYDVLKPGGYIVLDDFIGPTRQQWTERNMRIASRVRNILPEKYLRDPRNPERLVPTNIERPNIDEFIASDPTECADSGRIVSSLHKHFPDADIIETGGAIYHLALNEVLANINEDDAAILDLLLLIDDLCVELGETHYAIAIATKN